MVPAGCMWYLHVHFTMTRLQSQLQGTMTFTEHVLYGQRPFLRRDGHEKWQSGRVVKDMSTEILDSSWGDWEVTAAKKVNFWVVQPVCRMCQDHKLLSFSDRGSFWWGTAMPPSSRGTWNSMGALLMALIGCWSHRIWDLAVMSSSLLSCR